MRRLSQALQIEYDTIKHGELVCKHALTVQITFLSEMDVKKSQVSKKLARLSGK